MVLLIIVHPWSEGVPGPGEASAPRLTSRRWILDMDLLLKPSHHLLGLLHQLEESCSQQLFQQLEETCSQVVSGPGFAPGRRGPTGDRVGIASDAQERTPTKPRQQQLQQQSSTDVDVALTDRFKDQHDEWQNLRTKLPNHYKFVLKFHVNKKYICLPPLSNFSTGTPVVQLFFFFIGQHPAPMTKVEQHHDSSRNSTN